jgi:hypothetical protein
MDMLFNSQALLCSNGYYLCALDVVGRCGAATISPNAKLLLLVRLKVVYASRSVAYCRVVDRVSLCCGDKPVELKQRTRQPASQCYRSDLCCSDFESLSNVVDSCSAVAVMFFRSFLLFRCH